MRKVLTKVLFLAMVLLVFSCSNEGNESNSVQPGKDIVVPDYQVVLNFFKDLNGIPRPSKHEEKVRQYLTDFAKAVPWNAVSMTATS